MITEPTFHEEQKKINIYYFSKFKWTETPLGAGTSYIDILVFGLSFNAFHLFKM